MIDVNVVIKEGAIHSINNKRTTRFSLVKGEVKRIKFSVIDINNDYEDLTGALFTFHVKETKGAVADLTVVNASFDITNIATGVIYCPINTSTLTSSTDYYCELQIDLTGTNVEHSGEMIMTINQPIVE